MVQGNPLYTDMECNDFSKSGILKLNQPLKQSHQKKKKSLENVPYEVEQSRVHFWLQNLLLCIIEQVT